MVQNHIFLEQSQQTSFSYNNISTMKTTTIATSKIHKKQDTANSPKELEEQQEPSASELQKDGEGQFQQQDNSESIEEENDMPEQVESEEGHEEFQQKQNNRGVCYLSRIPPYMKPNYIRKLLESYMIERIYLLPESQWSRKNRIKRGGNKKLCFREGWVQFADKRMAKMAALTLNGKKMVTKKGSFYSEDLWNLKYLPKFKWHNLTERLAHEQRLKRERLKVQLQMQRKVQDFYSQKIAKSKMINGMLARKAKKGKQVQQPGQRTFQQARMAPQIRDQ